MDTDRTVGLYLDAGTILRNPGYLETLRDRIGLNLVIVGFCGELPSKVLDLSPYDGSSPSDECLNGLLCRHLDGRPSATSLDRARRSGPHRRPGGSDADLHRAIDQAHRLGVRVWLLSEAWTTSDFDVVMFCPSRKGVNDWLEAAYSHMATAYGADGLDITHARYPMTSFPRGLFLCTCEGCARAADGMGFDMARMTGDLRAARARLAALPGARLAPVLQEALGAPDVFQALGLASGVWDWFEFRSRLVERAVGRFRDAVHAAAGPGFVFGIDTYPASLAMFAGHDQTRWDRFSDFASPLVSHLDIFPMKTLAAWAQGLRDVCADLGESEAMRLICRLVGYDGLGLPDRIADFALGEPDCEYRNVPLADFVLLDTAKARLLLPPGTPSYPIIQGGGAPHLWPRASIEAIIDGLLEQGHQGYMLQGTASLVEYPLRP